MPPIHHRDPGVIGLLGDPTRKTYYGLIVDGLHSHPNTVRIAYGARRDGCVLVTDGEYSIFTFVWPNVSIFLEDTISLERYAHVPPSTFKPYACAYLQLSR